SVPGNDEISPGVSWCLTGAARYPSDPPAVTRFLGLGNWLIPKVKVGSPDLARDAVDLVAPTIDSLAGVVEHTIFRVDLLNGRAPARGVVFTEDFLKIAGQQGRYAVGHSPVSSRHRVRLAPKDIPNPCHTLAANDDTSSWPATVLLRRTPCHAWSSWVRAHRAGRRRDAPPPTQCRQRHGQGRAWPDRSSSHPPIRRSPYDTCTTSSRARPNRVPFAGRRARPRHRGRTGAPRPARAATGPERGGPDRVP